MFLDTLAQIYYDAKAVCCIPSMQVHGDSAMPSSDPRAGGVRNGMGADRWRNDHTGAVAPSYSYDDLLRRRGSLLSFVRHGSATAATEVNNEAATHQQREQAKLQLQSIFGTELSDAERVELLERCAWDVQRAVAEHFNDEATSQTALSSGASASEVEPTSMKRPAQSADRKQHKKGKQREQRSVLSMWKPK